MVEKRNPKRKASDSNRVGFLKQSKKYAKGREYQTLEGRIKIINRYLENGEIMISYLNMETNKIIYAGELDVNSMLNEYASKTAQIASEATVVINKANTITEDLKAMTEHYEAIIEKQQEIINILMDKLKRG